MTRCTRRPIVTSMTNTSKAMQLVAKLEDLKAQTAETTAELAKELGLSGFQPVTGVVHWPEKKTGPRTSAKPAPKSKSKDTTPIAAQVHALLENSPHTFPMLWSKLGPENKKAIRSTVDKKTVSGVYKRNDRTGMYSVARPGHPPKAPKKAAPKKSVKKATKAAAVVTMPGAPYIARRNDKTPPASTSGAKEQTELPV